MVPFETLFCGNYFSGCSQALIHNTFNGIMEDDRTCPIRFILGTQLSLSKCAGSK